MMHTRELVIVSGATINRYEASGLHTVAMAEVQGLPIRVALNAS